MPASITVNPPWLAPSPTEIGRETRGAGYPMCKQAPYDVCGYTRATVCLLPVINQLPSPPSLAPPPHLSKTIEPRPSYCTSTSYHPHIKTNREEETNSHASSPPRKYNPCTSTALKHLPKSHHHSPTVNPCGAITGHHRKGTSVSTPQNRASTSPL